MKLSISKATNLAIQAAKESIEKHRVGCIIYNHKHHTTGFNRVFGDVKVNTRNTKFSIHAEEMAIIKGSRIGINFHKSTMIIIRLNKNNDLRLAKPCFNCQNLICSVGIPTIYYSQDFLNRELITKNFKSL